MQRKVCYAAERNKEPILGVLREIVRSFGERPVRILEIASGTGEHANHFASALASVEYLPTEPMESMHDSIRAWTEGLSHVHPPIALDVSHPESAVLPDGYSPGTVDLMLCINMVHISPFSSTHGLFRLASSLLSSSGVVLTYGPYRVGGTMVESNVAFDRSLREQNPEWGVRDLEEVEAVAKSNGLRLKETVQMPANNLCVVFTR